MIVTEQMLQSSFDLAGLTLEERFEGCGFVYFPLRELSGEKGRSFSDRGRVMWSLQKFEYPEGSPGERIDRRLGLCKDTISIWESWGKPTERQFSRISDALKPYIKFRHQTRSGEFAR